MAEPNRDNHAVRFTRQKIQNNSFDQDFNISASEIAGYHVDTDTLKRIVVDSIGRLRVVIENASNTISESVLEHGSATTVAGSSLSTLLTYIVTSTDLYLDSIIATGEVDAEYQISIDAVLKVKYRTSEQDRTMKLEFPVSQIITVGSIITIKVIHYNAVTADFDTTLIGHKI